jgi:replication-associated recombination protein RarA
MTRSNAEGQIGFMSAPERLNVLITRARNCLIMLGNINTFIQSKKGAQSWTPFFELLKKDGHLYDGLPTICERHPEKKALLRTPDDFHQMCPDGGCDEPCLAALPCGQHSCARRCHQVTDHSNIHCTESIKKQCERNHKITIKCEERNKVCYKCKEEDDNLRRQVERDLELERKRKARESAYAQELQKIQIETDHQRRFLKYQAEEEAQKKTLSQKRAELEGVKQAVFRAQAQKEKELARSKERVAEKKSAGELSTKTKESPHESGAQREWEDLKKSEGVSSAPVEDLMSMIGLEEVKSEFLDIKSKVDTAIRQDISLSSERYSCSLLGNPGTGKTTVARLYAQFLTSVGVIPGSCFKETTGAALAHDGVSGCKSLIDEILSEGGGVLFIDEAYQLSSGNSSGGSAVLDYLLPEVENMTGKVVFILAGYNKQMESFFAHNPGLPSRFPIEMKFADYTDEELLGILELKLNKRFSGRIKCEDGMRGLFCRIVARRIGRGRGKDGFGNARTVENTLSKICQRQSTRLRRERRDGDPKNPPNDFLLTKADIIGPEPSEALSKSAAWQKIQKLVGLQQVKDSVESLVDSITQNYQQELLEQPLTEYSLNKVFLGNPGTGKTTVAKHYGQILADLGLLSKGEVIVKNPSDFIGSVLGASEQQTKGILAAAVGKVLVIDEAYGLYGGTQLDPYKTGVIDTIVAEVQGVPGDDRCVLLLGYKDQMEQMFQDVNPGLSRRFPLASGFYFEDFNQSQLREILGIKLGIQGFEATDKGKEVALEILDRARNRPNFGNAGEVDIILNDAKMKHQIRVKKEKCRRGLLEPVDFDPDFNRAQRSETNIDMLFKGTFGAEDTVELLKGYQRKVKNLKALGMDPKEEIPFNFLFRGPPGTGKTTTAKKFGKVFYDMGFLANAEVHECSVSDLVAPYVGQTALKVRNLFDKTLGRVLFIDEAYRLAEGQFCKEALDEMVDCVTKEKYAKKLIIILAGYEKDIDNLMSQNEGLTSRFSQVINFTPLSITQSFQLLTSLLKSRQKKLEATGVRLSLEIFEQLASTFRVTIEAIFLKLSRQKSWGSARDVELVAKQIFDQVLSGISDSGKRELVIEESVVISIMDKLYADRELRSGPTPFSPPHQILQKYAFASTGGIPPTPFMTKIETKTHHAEQKPDEPAKDKDLISPKPDRDVGQRKTPTATRDHGVSDEIWEQLQRDRKMQEEQDQEYRQLQQAKLTARGEEREKLIAILFEEERRRKVEEELQKRLQFSGRCPVGYAWIKQSLGYRCAGGSHWIADADLGKV